MTPPTTQITAKLVAEHILWLRRDARTTPRALIKLVYLCHAWALGLLNRGLISDPVVVGRFGPVYEDLMHKYEVFGNDPITQTGRTHEMDLDPEVVPIIKKVNSVYGELSDETLSDLTHRKDTPWSRQFQLYGEGVEIPNDLIKRYYHEQIAKAEAAEAAKAARAETPQ